MEVKEIADDGFPYFGPCEKVIVPKGIEIGKRAFAGVKDVEIPSGD